MGAKHAAQQSQPSRELQSHAREAQSEELLPEPAQVRETQPRKDAKKNKGGEPSRPPQPATKEVSNGESSSKAAPAADPQPVPTQPARVMPRRGAQPSPRPSHSPLSPPKKRSRGQRPAAEVASAGTNPEVDGQPASETGESVASQLATGLAQYVALFTSLSADMLIPIRLYKHGILTDVTVKYGDSGKCSREAHRVVLSAASLFFEGYFNSESEVRTVLVLEPHVQS